MTTLWYWYDYHSFFADKEKLINLPNDVSLWEAELELELRKCGSQAHLCHCTNPTRSHPVLGEGKSPEAKNQSV